MPRITVNPDVQSAGGRIVWAKGRYPLRIREIQEQTSSTGKAMLVIEYEPVGEVTDIDGRQPSNPGRLWDRVLVEPVQTKLGNTISFLRPLIEAAGLTWGGEIDTDDLVGKEVLARVTVGEYQGNERNEITGYVKAS